MTSKIKVKPGDLALVKTTDDVLIKKGSYGVICGKRGKRVEITFNYYTPFLFKDGTVTASGGPVRLVKLSQLEPTKKKKNQQFHIAEGLSFSKSIKKKVKVFNVYLK